MSKKTKGKTKAKAKPAPKKKAATAKTARAVLAAAPAAPKAKFTAAATIFVYDAGGQTRVRTSPQMLGAGPGSIEWTVVNLTSGPMPDVDITWRDDSPWGGKQPIPIRNGNYRRSLDDARDGHYKYNVTCNGFTEDPEIEIPGN